MMVNVINNIRVESNGEPIYTEKIGNSRKKLSSGHEIKIIRRDFPQKMKKVSPSKTNVSKI